MSCPDGNRHCDGTDLLHGVWCRFAVINERDRYREALEKIDQQDQYDPFEYCIVVRRIAWDALNSVDGTDHD